MNCNAKAVDALQNIPYNKKELDPVDQAPFYLHKYNTRMGIGWKFAPTEIESEEKDLEHCVPGLFLS